VASLTISVDERLLKRARRKVAAQGTSVDAVVRSFLAEYVRQADARKRAVREILALSRTARAAGGNRRRRRDELHDRTSE
jgi:hypothetical protein